MEYALLSVQLPLSAHLAALCSVRIIKKVLDLVENFVNAATALLKEKHRGVLLTGVVLLCADLCKVNKEVLENFRKGGGGAFRDPPRRFNQYSKRFRKQTLLRNVSEFAELLFQSWQSDSDEDDQSSSPEHSWFRPHFRDDRFKRGKSRNRGPQPWRRHFEFVEDEDNEFETFFRSTLGGNQYFYWSQEPGYRNSSGYSSYYKSSSDWRHRFHEEYDSDSYTESERSEANMTSDRLALGLSASGPLNLDDVKNAYRACALKWHPDRHQGSSKVVAEEKFKICSAAYQSLCDKLILN